MNILKYPNSILLKKCTSVKKITPKLLQLSKDMLDVMYSNKGIGLAANQIGINKRLIVIDISSLSPDDYSLTELEKIIPMPLVIFNPVIIKKENTVKYTEGCLSFPDVYKEIERYRTIEVIGIDQFNNKIQFVTDGILSVCIQHEIDHLNGEIFINK